MMVTWALSLPFRPTSYKSTKQIIPKVQKVTSNELIASKHMAATLLAWYRHVLSATYFIKNLVSTYDVQLTIRLPVALIRFALPSLALPFLPLSSLALTAVVD